MANATARSTKSTAKPDRSHMIAEAAYYLAEQRGFAGGDPVRDWLDAEALIDDMARKAKRKTRAR